ncbi:heparan-alpha-glucosaminide N-acetyltransferase [Stappia indica]|uniref:heparan-alpha-glucosaminide N-acetyltransferase n=1 Tax=Stappia indica TaxID=538381 RepID=UPI001CD607AE|nr:heparan-alpha-glucosaminide N-acetyltransferase [Stappia indica]MCA1300665.1 DUF1624 domain-containing protein [Stappia indica]
MRLTLHSADQPVPERKSAATPRLDLLDVARGLALLTMAVYHLSWDLAWFRLVDWPVSSGPGWRLFAALIAGSFLFLVGVGLVLAHRRKIQWRKATIRLARIALAAAAISAATHLALGDQYVRFGILHAIAASSLIALPFVRLPVPVTLGAAALAAALPRLLPGVLGDSPWLLWTGLTGAPPAAVDYVPLLPWLAPVLLGVAAARLALARPGLIEGLGRWQTHARWSRLAAFAGRHSLIVYLLHQPVLYASVWLVVATGLTPDRTAREFVEECVLSCTFTMEEAACQRVCACTLEALRRDGTWAALLQSPTDPALTREMQARFGICHRDELARTP